MDYFPGRVKGGVTCGRRRVRACYLASVVVPQVEALLGDLARPDGPQGDLHRWGRAGDAA